MTADESTTVKGRRGEDVAVERLVREGYVVVGRNVRVGRGEIDVVARDGDVLVFVEVRRRERAEDAMMSVDAKKQARITAAAGAYVATLTDEDVPRCRFDVVVVAGDATELVKNAFLASEATS